MGRRIRYDDNATCDEVMMQKRSRQLRVAVVRHDRFPGDPHLRRNVHALRDAGLTVDVICDREPNLPCYERSDGVTVLRLLFGHKRHSMPRYLFEYLTLPFLASALVAVRSLWRPYRYVEVDNPPDWLVLAGLLPRLQGASVVLYMFENMPETAVLDYSLSRNHPLVRALVTIQRICAGLGHCLIAPHEMGRSILMRQGIAPHKITAVVPNVPDPSIFLSRVAGSKTQIAAGTPPCCEAEPRAGDGRFRLVTHGTLLKRYGIQTLLEAMAHLGKRIPGLHLDVIGDGEYRPELERLAASLDLGDVVTFTGRIPFDQVAPRLLQADVGVVPMWADYFFPNKLTEYLALGMPVIITDCPAVRLYFDDSAVYYVEAKSPEALAEAIMDLYRNPARRARLATMGHSVYREKVSWDRTKHDYLAVYGVHPAQIC
jgi:glycosyltransferase involved in cell wall biosynthesis